MFNACISLGTTFYDIWYISNDGNNDNDSINSGSNGSNNVSNVIKIKKDFFLVGRGLH